MVEKFDTNFLTVEQVSNFMRLSKEQSVSLLLNLTYAGFIIFDYDNMNFIVKNKLIDWVKSSAGKLDYDVINFFSNIKGASNATLSLLNYDLTLRGVNSVHMSDSQQVTIYPNNQELILKKNRDFDFSGVIQAGRFDIMGSNFSFIYDEFKFNMPNVDSLRIYAETGQVDIEHGVEGPESASAVEDFFRHHVRMPTTEDVDDAARFDRCRHQLRGGFDLRSLRFHFVDQHANPIQILLIGFAHACCSPFPS